MKALGSRAAAAALAAAILGAPVELSFAQSPPAYPLPSTWRFIRPDVIDSPVYFSERWGIRIGLPIPNVWCGTDQATDRGGYIILRSNADCRRSTSESDISIRLSARWNSSGIDDDLPPIREVIARERCGAPWSPALGVRVLPRVAGLPAFECVIRPEQSGILRGSPSITVILFRGDKSGGRSGIPPYPEVEYHLDITAPPERAAEARAIMSDLLRRVQLRPL